MTRRRTPRRAVIRLVTGQAARATHHPFPHRTPVLALEFGACSVLVTPPDEVTVDDLAFARQLAHEASRYARAIERRLSGLPDGAGVAA